MAQFRPRPRTTPPETPVLTRLSADRTVSVKRAAAAGISAGDAGFRPRSDRDRLADLGYEEVRRAAVSAGRTPPSPRTVRRWRQQDRIPHAGVAEMVRRRDTVARMGGVDAAADVLGRSASAVRDWRSGRTHTLRPDAARRLRRTQTRHVLADSGIDPRRTRPVISFRADVHARTGGGDYDFRSSKSFEFGAGLDAESMPRADIEDLAIALAEGDHDRATAILEEHASTRWAAFDTYSDDEGFHFENITDFHINWH